MPYVPLSTSSPAPAPVATGKGYIPISSGSPAPIAPAAPAGGYQPISKVGILTPITPAAPISPATAPSAAPAPISTPSGIPATALKGSLGGGYGAATDVDPASGKPLLTYENSQAKASQLLSDRTAPTFDPTKPDKISPKILQNPRMKESVSQTIKNAVGGTAYTELDHIMPLELGGSNNKTNLRIEPAANPNQKYSASNPTNTDQLENDIAAQVHSGQISLVDGWKAMAKAKGITLPEQGGAVPNLGQKGIQPNTQANEQSTPSMSVGQKALQFFPSTMSTLASLQIDPASLKADPSKAIGDAWNSIKDSVTSEYQNIKKVFTAPTTAGKVSAGLSATAGAVNVGLSPITALFSAANDIPILGTVSKLISLPFETMGDAGRTDAIPIVNALPISQASKDQLVSGVGDVVSLAGQLLLGKGAEDVRANLVDKYGPTAAATIVDKAQQLAGQEKAAAPTGKPLPDTSAPKDTSIKLGSGIDPGLDKFVKEDVKPALDKGKEIAANVKNGLTIAKDAVTNIIEPAKALEMKNPEAYGDVMRAIHTPDAEALSFDNTKSKTFDTNFSKLEQFFSKFSDKQLEDFNNTRGTPATPEAQTIQSEAAARLDPKLQDPQLMTAIKETSDHVFDYATQHGIDLNYFEDYFNGSYKDPAKVAKFMDYWRSTESYTKKKTLPTPADAANFGLELKDKNPITNIRKEMQAVAQRVAMKELREKTLLKNPDLMVETDKATPAQLRNFAKINDPAFNGTVADPHFAKLVNNLISTNKVSSNLFTKSIRQISFLAQ